MSVDDSETCDLPERDRLRGLCEASLRRVLHDLGGPLNTISILTELVRSRLDSGDAQGQEVCERLSDAVQQMARMIGRVRGVSASMGLGSGAGPLRQALAAAAERARDVRTVEIDCDETVAVSAPSDLLAALLDAAYGCCEPGAEVAWQVRNRPPQVEIRFEQRSGGRPFPAPRARGHIVDGDPGAPRWFEWTCRLEGLGGNFSEPTSATPTSAVMLLHAASKNGAAR